MRAGQRAVLCGILPFPLHTGFRCGRFCQFGFSSDFIRICHALAFSGKLNDLHLENARRSTKTLVTRFSRRCGVTETRKRLLLRCRHKCYLAPVGFHHYILLVSVARASSAGDMMAVHQTPFNYSWYGHSKDFHLRSLRSTIIFCSVATIPLSGPYSCIFASFSFDAAGYGVFSRGPLRFTITLLRV